MLIILDSFFISFVFLFWLGWLREFLNGVDIEWSKFGFDICGVVVVMLVVLLFCMNFKIMNINRLLIFIVIFCFNKIKENKKCYFIKREFDR